MNVVPLKPATLMPAGSVKLLRDLADRIEAGEIEEMVATKWAPMEYVMTAAHYVEGFVRSVLFPDDEPVFQFLLGAPIEVNDAA